MKKIGLDFYEQIDWADLRAKGLRRKGWRNKKPADWDSKATSFSSRNRSSRYVDLFIENLSLKKSDSVLDIGSGPGTLALPIAQRVQHVTAMDFSGEMLKILRNGARQQNLTNVSTVQCSWEDDWAEHGILPHDVVIASRSMGVEHLEQSLLKLDGFAKRYVCVSDRIGITPFDAGAFRALGRDFDPGPDYIFTINVLYTLGIHPNVRIIQLEAQTTYQDLDDALRSYQWMFREISDKETETLKAYLEEKIIARSADSITIQRESPPRWALIWWQKETR